MITIFIILIILISIKAVFSATETAFTYLNQNKFNQLSKNNYKAKLINNILKNKIKLYSVVSVGITISELFASIFAAEIFLPILTEKFNALNTLNINENIIRLFSIIIITFILSYFTVMFGQILPKKIAKNNPEKTAYRFINLFILLSKLNSPFEKLLSISEKIICTIFNISNENTEKLSEKEIKLIISEGYSQGIVDKKEKNLLYNVFKFDDILVKDIYIKKEKVAFINISSSKETILNNIGKYKYTRIPIYKNTKDNIVGILNIKDITMQYINNQSADINCFENIREAFFVKEKEKIIEVFEKMQLNSKHLAIVKNDTNNVLGIITIEDILEKLVGNIFDEFDRK